MKLSTIPVSFFDKLRSGEMPMAEWMDFARELGLDGVECAPPLLEPLGPVTAAEFRKLAESRGLEVSNYTAYSDFAHPDPLVREDGVARAVGNIEVAKQLGAPSMRALTGQAWPGVDVDEGIGWVVAGIREVAEAAGRAGLKVNVENHTKAFTWDHFDFALRAEVFERIFDGLRDTKVGVQFDTANPLVAGDDPMALFEKLRSRIGYVHANDVRRPEAFEFVVVGTGIAPVREIVTGLVEQGYDGWIGIEEASRTGREGFQQAVSFLRSILN